MSGLLIVLITVVVLWFGKSIVVWLFEFTAELHEYMFSPRGIFFWKVVLLPVYLVLIPTMLVFYIIGIICAVLVAKDVADFFKK